MWICSVCNREVRLANTSSAAWTHIEDDLPLCDLGACLPVEEQAAAPLYDILAQGDADEEDDDEPAM